MWAWIALAFAVGALAMGRKTSAATSIGDGIKAVAEAIARAEGFYVAGSLPARANNPGNLKIGDRGFGVIDGKTIFATVQDGWNALYRQLQLIRNGKSRNFKPTDTFQEFARTWVGTPDFVNWLGNVSKRLGATPLDSIGRYLA